MDLHLRDTIQLFSTLEINVSSVLKIDTLVIKHPKFINNFALKTLNFIDNLVTLPR